jgi:HSP20 family protein
MAGLMTFDPFSRDFERLAGSLLGRRSAASPVAIPVDAYRRGDEFIVHVDLPGVSPESIELTVEKNVLSVGAERHWSPEEGDQVLLAERPYGRFSRQLYLSDNLDTDRIDARFDKGVLTLRIPVSEQAKPRKVQIASGGTDSAILTGSVAQH